MANEQSGMPLRRWRQFYGAFAAIDDAIEAAGHPRAVFVDMRVQIVKLLRGATHDGVAEQLCAALDDAMVEALVTLRAAPVPHGALASTNLVRVVGALGNHGSARIRRLVGDVVHGLSAGVKEELDKLSADDRIQRQGIADSSARGRKEKLHIPPPKTLPTVPARRPVAEALKKKVYQPPAKMLPTAATVSTPSTSETKKPAVAESTKMEATKRNVARGLPRSREDEASAHHSEDQGQGGGEDV